MAKKKAEEKETAPQQSVSETENAEKTAGTHDFEKEFGELNDKYLRLLAEYDNFRKRTAKEKEELGSFVKAQVLTSFLSVLDNLSRAVESETEETPLYKGVLMVKKQIEEVLFSFGVEEIPALGEPFDPQVHNAVMRVDDENAGEGTVVSELQKGYRADGRVLRYSMVSVAN